MEQLELLAQKVAKATYLIQTLRAEKQNLDAKTQTQAARIDELEMIQMERDEEIAALKSALADRESQIQAQNEKMSGAAERLQGMLAALAMVEDTAAPVASPEVEAEPEVVPTVQETLF
jgi:uncharacterized coiled-coil protein SlyX